MSTQPQDPLSTRWSMIDSLYGERPEAAWQWFVERYRPFARHVLSAVLPAGSDVDAAESEFWGYLFLSRVVDRADRARRFRGLLFGTLRNFARRWRDSRGMDPMPNEALDALADDESATATATRLWAHNVLRNGLARLRTENQNSADALERFYGIGPQDWSGEVRQPLSAAEVADQLALPRQGIYMQLHRGRARLRSILESELREGCADDESFRDELRLLLRIAATRVPGLME